MPPTDDRKSEHKKQGILKYKKILYELTGRLDDWTLTNYILSRHT